MVYILFLIGLFILLRVLFICSRSKTELALLSLIVLSCIIEVAQGYYQLLFDSSYQSALLSVKGHFSNSGIYSGFLTVSACIILACYNRLESKNVKFMLGLLCSSIIILLPVTQSRSSILALSICFLFFWLKERKYKTLKKRTLIIGCFLAIVCVTGLYFFKKPSADGRFFIYKTCFQVIKKNGTHGVGALNFGGEYGSAQADYFIRQAHSERIDKNSIRKIDDRERMIVDCPQYAFNDCLQLGVEYGFPLMLLFMIVNAYTLVSLYRENSIWFYGLIAFCVFGLFSYPLKIIPLQLLYVILLASCTYGKHNTVFYSFAGVIWILLLILQPHKNDRLNGIISKRRYHNEWIDIQNNHKMRYYGLVVPMCDSLFDEMQNDYEFLFIYGQSLNKIEDYKKSDSILQIGTRISSDPMFWNVMGNNSLAQGNYREAEACYTHAFYMIPNRLYPLILLAELYHAEGDTVYFLEMADIIETFKPKVESESTEFLRQQIRDLHSKYNPTIAE